MSTNAKPYKETLNLPATRFEMKANLTAREPQIQARWREVDLYGQIRRARAGRPRRVLHDGLEGGFIFRQLKPIHWCLNDRTALAEAELEYSDESSPSIYVNFPMVAGVPVSWATASGMR